MFVYVDFAGDISLSADTRQCERVDHQFRVRSKEISVRPKG